MPIAAGERAHYVTLHAPAGTRGSGDPSVAVNLATHLPARILAVPLAFQMQERMASGGMMRQTLYAVTLPYRDDIDSDLVLIEECHRRMELQILIIRPSDKSDELELTCVAGDQPLVETSPLTYAEQVRLDGASHYWRLNDTTGTTATDHVGTAPGTLVGGVMLGQPGALADGDTAMAFDGTTGGIETAAVTVPLIATIELWVRTDVSGTHPLWNTRDLSTGSRFIIQTQPEGLSIYGQNPPAGIFGSGRDIQDGAWHHLALVLDGTVSTMYVDGVSDLGPQAFPRTTPSVGGVRLAWNTTDATTFLSGRLDDVALYPRALTAEDVARHYALRSAPA